MAPSVRQVMLLATSLSVSPRRLHTTWSVALHHRQEALSARRRTDGARHTATPRLAFVWQDGGNVFAYLKDLLKFGSASEATDAAASAQACAGGVLVMPFLGPERAPGWRARHLTITGMRLSRQASVALLMLAGVTHSTQPGAIMRAGLEGVAFRLALIYRLMKPQLSNTSVPHSYWL